MIWFFCFILVVLILCRSGYILLRNKSKFKSAKVFIYVILASYIIYFPVFMNRFSVPGNLLGGILNTMQMVTIDANFLDYYDMISASLGISIFSSFYIFLLGFLHILVPVFAVVTAYDCIVNFLSYIRIGMINFRSSDVYVFSEMNDNSINLALDISKNLGRNVEFIFADVHDDRRNHYGLINKLNFYTATTEKVDALNIKIKKRKIYYFNISKSSDKNINNTLKLIEKYIALPKEKQKSVLIYLFSDSHETEIIVDSMNKGVIGIRLIDTARLPVYNMFDEYPLYNSINNGQISLLICGLNEIGVETLKAALWLGQLVDVRLKINVIDETAIKKRSQLKFKCPEIFSDEYEIEFYQSDLNNTSFNNILSCYCSDTTYAVVCGNNDEENISLAVYLRRFFLKKDLTVKFMPVITAYIDNYNKTDVVRKLKTPEPKQERKINYQIIPFGGAKSIYNYQAIMNSSIENLSINVHLAYERIFSNGDEINLLEALERYNAFEVNKSSNRSNALHIRYKLWMLGLDYTSDSNAEQVDLSDYFTEEKLNKLTVAEHDRWMAFLRTEGWTSATVEDVENYKRSDLSKGRHNCPILLMHPYLCKFNELEEISNRLELSNATVYDWELIRMIPEILTNKDINNCNYKIIKRNDNNGKK